MEEKKKDNEKHEETLQNAILSNVINREAKIMEENNNVEAKLIENVENNATSKLTNINETENAEFEKKVSEDSKTQQEAKI